jgi:prepilin peptidase CpaA
MTAHTLLSFGPMIGLLACAAVTDLRARRIPNWLTLSLAITGVVQSFSAGATVSPMTSVVGLLLGFFLPFILFAMGALGGGDVKMLAGIGAWMGALGVFQVFVIAAIVGLVIVLVQSAYQGRLVTLFRNSTVLMINLVHLREVGVEHASATGKSCRSLDPPLPYAVPVLTAVLLLMTFG